jgi:hypothetical protein
MKEKNPKTTITPKNDKNKKEINEWFFVVGSQVVAEDVSFCAVVLVVS